MSGRSASNIRAVDMPEVRAEMIRYLADHGRMLYRNFIAAGLMPIRPALPAEEAACELARLEAARLAGDLYYVSAPMAELAMRAAPTLPAFTLAPQDVPSESGLMCFESPVCKVEVGGAPTYITGASWGLFTPSSARHSGIWVSWYADRGLTIGAGYGFMPRLIYDNDTQIPFSEQPVPAFDASTGRRIDGVGDYPVDVLKSAWLLMQQPLAKSEEVTADRASRKRIQRMQQEAASVRVIQLRRAPSPGGAGESDREYHHQWIVRGHWRQQWYPGRQVHRPVWIAPHVKGPEGAPLIGGEKVHAWVR